MNTPSLDAAQFAASKEADGSSRRGPPTPVLLAVTASCHLCQGDLRLSKSFHPNVSIDDLVLYSVVHWCHLGSRSLAFFFFLKVPMTSCDQWDWICPRGCHHLKLSYWLRSVLVSREARFHFEQFISRLTCGPDLLSTWRHVID